MTLNDILETLHTHLDKGSKRPWRFREIPGSSLLPFIEAERADPNDPYNIEVMGDEDNLYMQEQRTEDAKLIIDSVNYMPVLLSHTESLLKALTFIIVYYGLKYDEEKNQIVDGNGDPMVREMVNTYGDDLKEVLKTLNENDFT